MPEPSSPEQSSHKPNVFEKMAKLRKKFVPKHKGGLTPEQLEVIKKLYPDVPLSKLGEMPSPPSPQNPPGGTRAGGR